MSILNKLLLFFVVVSITACNPLMTPELRKKKNLNKKFQRFLKNNPELSVADTIRDTITIIVPEIIHDTIIQTNKDVSGVDSLLASMNLRLDSVSRLELTQTIKNYVIERPVIKDTLVYEFDEVTIKLFDQDGNIGLHFKVHQREVSKETETVVQKMMMQKLNFFERIAIAVSTWSWRILWIFIVIAVLYVSWRILKNFFPFLNF